MVVIILGAFYTACHTVNIGIMMNTRNDDEKGGEKNKRT